MKLIERFKKNSFLFSLSVLLNIFLVFLLIYVVVFCQNKINSDIRFTRDNNTNYKFINPILDCEDYNSNTSSDINYQTLDSFIDNLIKKDNLKTASVYYRDLNNGPWYGYNEKEYFAPASLLKLPVMISLFKSQEENPNILQKKIKISSEDTKDVLVENIKSDKQVEVGKEYSMLELVNSMIQESDNVALNVVTNNFKGGKYLDETFKQVGVDTEKEDGNLVLRTKDYAGFFRVLYNASYLSKDNSELALKILSETSFTEGIVSGVPKYITVAHKFGERDYTGSGLVSDAHLEEGIKQIHDCGIVYYPSKPYILCVMTRGEDVKTEESFIQDVSSRIFNEVKSSDKSSTKDLSF